MILSDNTAPDPQRFKSLMQRLDVCLNDDAKRREEYYVNRNGLKLEQDVYEALSECAIGTPFQGSIQLISGASFPDIVVGKRYGVEVKSTEKNKWTSTGSSILESTRNQDVTRIYMTFGKLGKPVEFLSKPYESCLSGIAVTHYPRYLIDMRLREGETIFDKMGIEYDTLRKMEEPATAVAEYYRKKMTDGEQLWWTGSDAVPPTIRAWSVLSPEEKARITATGFVYFPEVASSSNPTKYNRYSLWLATDIGVVNPNARDAFSAGGKVKMIGLEEKEYEVPAVFGKIEHHKDLIVNILRNTDAQVLAHHWKEPVSDSLEGKLSQWIDQIVDYAGYAVGIGQAKSIMQHMFGYHSTAYNVKVLERKPVQDEVVQIKYAEPEQTTFKSKPKFDVSIDSKVSHKTLGIGTVDSIDYKTKHIIIRFSTGLKEFQYPTAFENGFLTIVKK